MTTPTPLTVQQIEALPQGTLITVGPVTAPLVEVHHSGQVWIDLGDDRTTYLHGEVYLAHAPAQAEG